ncbi:hypothetical protein ACO0LB_13085 [Undibacterium sp. SXout7W]|uniref:hypothetical protein n=1 Tax=Undibacterium sp. SXout7W TaxID=3413049 RepID=UPI003BF14D70
MSSQFQRWVEQWKGWRLLFAFILLPLLSLSPLQAKAQLQAFGDYPRMPQRLVSASIAIQPAEPDVADDPYQILQSMGDPDVRAWFKRQTDFSNQVLRRINGREALLQSLRMLNRSHSGAERLFEIRGMQFYSRTDADSRTRLFARVAATGAERLLYLTEKGEQLHFFTPAPDASLVAIAVSRSVSLTSSEAVSRQTMPARSPLTLKIIRTSDAIVLKDQLDKVAGIATEIGWRADASAVYYRRAAMRGDATDGSLWQHIVGQYQEEDQGVIGPGLSKQRKFVAGDRLQIHSRPGSDFMLAEVKHGSTGERSVYLIQTAQLKGAASPWQRVIAPADKVRDMALMADQLYLLSTKKNANGAVLQLDLKKPQMSSAKEVLPSGKDELLNLAPSKGVLYLHAAHGGMSKLFKIDTASNKKEELILPHDGRISQLLADSETEGAVIVLDAPNQAPLSYRVLPGGQIKNAEVIQASALGFHRFIHRQVSFIAADNQSLTLNLLLPQNMELSGQHVTLLQVERGSGVAKLARYNPLQLAWLEQGGIVATLLENEVPSGVKSTAKSTKAPKKKSAQPSSVDRAGELISVAEYLIREGYTNAKKLVVQENTPGKDHVALAIVRRPDLFAAAQGWNMVTEGMPSPVLSDKSIGTVAGNTVGKGKRSAEKRMIKSSLPVTAYEAAREGGRYPAMLINATIAENGAPAWMSAKFAAKLQVISANKQKPVLFRSDFNGAWKPDPVTDLADTWAFFLWQTGDKRFTLQP